MIANILVSLFSKGFGFSTENKEDDGTHNTSEGASGTGMGEGVGLNDVSDQITDEDQLLGTKEQVCIRAYLFCMTCKILLGFDFSSYASFSYVNTAAKRKTR